MDGERAQYVRGRINQLAEANFMLQYGQIGVEVACSEESVRKSRDVLKDLTNP